ncbi:MAG: ribosomal L7Ae/L30e/S12e/Gadd45 family protein [Clostridia bacterium]|nr:ribosomal L7Ae/L30e/S12e/Gadd45 family protein [Clostridia bacterium]
MENAFKQVQGLLGLSARAGQLIFGESGCVTAIRAGKAALVLVDESASENAKKRYQDACRSHECAMVFLPQDLLSQAVGRSGRMACVCPPGPLAQRLKQVLANHILVLS